MTVDHDFSSGTLGLDELVDDHVESSGSLMTSQLEKPNFITLETVFGEQSQAADSMSGAFTTIGGQIGTINR